MAMQETVERYLPGFTPQQLFDIAADIESYPLFLFWCEQTKVRERQGNRLLVDNVFGVGPARAKFQTRAVFDPPTAIDVTSTDGPFERLHVAWRFEPVREVGAMAEEGTRVRLTIEQKFRVKLFEAALAPFRHQLEDLAIRAFVKRARQVYGT